MIYKIKQKHTNHTTIYTSLTNQLFRMTSFTHLVLPDDKLERLWCTFIVDKKNHLDVTFCILYFSSNSCSTCFGQPCAHHQELTTA